MRRYQVTIKIDYLNEENELHNAKIYADANNFYEAMGSATLTAYRIYEEINGLPFGARTGLHDGFKLIDV